MEVLQYVVKQTSPTVVMYTPWPMLGLAYELYEENLALKDQLGQQKALIEKLHSKLNEDSTTSNKPPSSDNPFKKEKKSARRLGSQSRVEKATASSVYALPKYRRSYLQAVLAAVIVWKNLNSSIFTNTLPCLSSSPLLSISFFTTDGVPAATKSAKPSFLTRSVSALVRDSRRRSLNFAPSMGTAGEPFRTIVNPFPASPSAKAASRR
ncbi:hypothetical protein [Desulfonatronum thioautotrophicum]|uniref:hypothetical protein n=1 Tax=Desulfonatronum thioautotrophicum TaxID=617001 RepID=UPI001294872C|nr:hypothetical protein [Desulfonatronum thioautotrophicum]